MRHLSLIFLIVALAACGKSPAGPPPPPPPPAFHDPAFVIFFRPAFTNLYQDSTIRITARMHAIEDPGNPDPVSIPADVYFNSIPNGGCREALSGSNSNDVRMHIVVSLVPVDRASGDTVGPVYQTDTLDVSPDSVPFPAPWGRDQTHMLLWKVKITDASSPRPTLLSFQLDTISFDRLASRDFRETGCQEILP